MMEGITNAHVIGMLIAISILAFGAWIGALWRESLARKEQSFYEQEENTAALKFKQDAVRQGFAKWEVDDFGEVSFVWIVETERRMIAKN